MTISLSTTATAAPQGIAQADGPGTAPLATVANNIIASGEVAQKLRKAMEGLGNPDAGSILSTQILTAQLSVMTAATSSAVKSMSDSARTLFQNGF
jgi:hypothetical protein